jgi:hypothetical protein
VNEIENLLKEATTDILDLLLRKNADYGDDNLRRFGRYGILVRVADKISRLQHMLENVQLTGNAQMAVDEAERDAWMDIAGYAIQAIRFINEEAMDAKGHEA